MSQQQDQQHMHGERRQAQTPFQGPERRRPMQFGETAAPANPGQEARLQEKIEEQRTSERDLAARVRPPEGTEPPP